MEKLKDYILRKRKKLIIIHITWGLETMTTLEWHTLTTHGATPMHHLTPAAIHTSFLYLASPQVLKNSRIIHHLVTITWGKSHSNKSHIKIHKDNNSHFTLHYGNSNKLSTPLENLNSWHKQYRKLKKHPRSSHDCSTTEKCKYKWKYKLHPACIQNT